MPGSSRTRCESPCRRIAPVRTAAASAPRSGRRRSGAFIRNGSEGPGGVEEDVGHRVALGHPEAHLDDLSVDAAQLAGIAPGIEAALLLDRLLHVGGLLDQVDEAA